MNRTYILRHLAVAVMAIVVLSMAHSANADLIAYYGLNETVNPSGGTTAADSSGNSRDGTYILSGAGPTVGAASANAGLYGTAAVFDDGSDAVQIPSLGSLSSNFTVAAWIKPTALSGVQRILSDARSPSKLGWAFSLSGDKLDFALFNVTGYTSTVSAVSTPNEWVHVAVVFDSNLDVTFYKNGQFLETIAGNSTPLASTQPYFIGRTNRSGAFEPFYGAIDEVRVYNTSLTANEIAALATVPEPASLVILAAGLVGLLAYAWRRQK